MTAPRAAGRAAIGGAQLALSVGMTVWNAMGGRAWWSVVWTALCCLYITKIARAVRGGSDA